MNKCCQVCSRSSFPHVILYGVSAQTAQARKEATRDAILDAAFERFTLAGYRQTSMEDIATASGISRAAVYLHFSNKERIFRTLSERIQDRHLREAEEAVGLDAPVEERLHRVLKAKLDTFMEVVQNSPHGAELLDENSRIAGDISQAGRTRFLRTLKRLVEDAAERGELAPERSVVTAAAAAEIMLDWTRGLEVDAHSLSAHGYRRRVRDAARLLVAGLGGEPRRAD